VEKLNTININCSNETLIKALKQSLMGYYKDIGTYEKEFENIQEEDFEQIAQDLIDWCN
jgi:hypothetical protein